MQKEQPKKIKTPKLLAGLFSAICGVIAAILLLAWSIINYQMEELITTRSSEYVKSITQIAADSSAEALLSDDKIQLKMLTQNVAKDAYINNAIIYAEDGQIVAQYPEKNTNTNKQNSDKNNSNEKASNKKMDFAIQSPNNVPFIQKISYQGVTAGWFKVNLNKELLETEFIATLKKAQRLIIVIAVIFCVFLLFIYLRYEKTIKKVSQYASRFIQLNAEQMPQDKKQWFQSLENLSNTRFLAIDNNNLSIEKDQTWLTGKTKENIFFCSCKFSMSQQNHEKTAENISKAQLFLQKTVQAQGAQFEGNILSGCEIIFLDCKNDEEALTEAITLTHILTELLLQLDLEIKMRAFIGKGEVLILENERGFVSGISLSNKLYDQIAQVLPFCHTKDIVYIGLQENELSSYVKIETIKNNDEAILATPIFRSLEVNQGVRQQSNRQINYISSDCEQ